MKEDLQVRCCCKKIGERFVVVGGEKRFDLLSWSVVSLMLKRREKREEKRKRRATKGVNFNESVKRPNTWQRQC